MTDHSAIIAWVNQEPLTVELYDAASKFGFGQQLSDRDFARCLGQAFQRMQHHVCLVCISLTACGYLHLR